MFSNFDPSVLFTLQIGGRAPRVTWRGSLE